MAGCRSGLEAAEKDSTQHAAHEGKKPMEEREAPSSVPGYAEVEIDPERIQLFGVQTEKVISRDLQKLVRAVGIVAADERRIAHIHTKFSGWIVDLFVNFTGQLVNKGEPLFSVYSPELLATQEEYLIAKKGARKQLEGLLGEEYLKTNQKLLESVKQRLELWDIPPEEIQRLEQQGTVTKTLTIHSPIKGVVLEKNAYAGMNVEPGMDIFTVVDLASVWILADIFEQDIAMIRQGQKATFVLNAFPDKTFEGNVDFINYVLDQTTRTTKVRFDFDNPDMLLKVGMYGVVKLEIPLGFVLAVPEAAVIDTGNKKIVFVEKGIGRYIPVEVHLGAKGEGYYQVLSGLKENDLVVKSSQFLMDSESRIQTSGHMHGMDKE